MAESVQCKLPSLTVGLLPQLVQLLQDLSVQLIAPLPANISGVMTQDKQECILWETLTERRDNRKLQSSSLTTCLGNAKK